MIKEETKEEQEPMFQITDDIRMKKERTEFVSALGDSSARGTFSNIS
jgi:hypothetical protein